MAYFPPTHGVQQALEYEQPNTALWSTPFTPPSPTGQLRAMALPSSPVSYSNQVCPGGPIDVVLTDTTMWKKFYATAGGTEMLVNVRGRDLFPRFEFTARNLDTFRCYVFGIKLHRLNANRMKNTKVRGWFESQDSAGDVPYESNEVLTSMKPGGEFMKMGVKFDKVKIYNIGQKQEEKENDDDVGKAASRKRSAYGKTPMAKRPRAALNMDCALQVTTQCVYLPIVTVYEVAGAGSPLHKVAEFNFELAKFHVVTEYKTQEIIKLKISENKHVRGDVKANASRKESEDSDDSRMSRASSTDSGNGSLDSSTSGASEVPSSVSSSS